MYCIQLALHRILWYCTALCSTVLHYAKMHCFHCTEFHRYIDKYCSHVSEDKRKTHCAMVAAMDDSIGTIMSTVVEEVSDYI